EGLVEVDGGGVPVEDGPFDAAALALAGEVGEGDEEGLAEAARARGGGDVEVLEVDAVPAEPGGVVGEEEGEALGDRVEIAHEGLAGRAPAETLAEERVVEHRLRRLDRVGLALVLGEL